MSLHRQPLPTDIEEGPDRETSRVPRSSGLPMLYVKEAPRLLRYFRMATKVHQDAEDLTQQTFVRYSSVPASQAEAIASPAAFLSRNAHNLLRDRARALGRRRVDQHVSLDDLPFSGSDPIAQLEARDMLVRMNVAIQAMKPRTRSIFLAHRIEGLSYREIAAQTGMTIKGVEKQMAKAIAIIHRAAGRS